MPVQTYSTTDLLNDQTSRFSHHWDVWYAETEMSLGVVHCAGASEPVAEEAYRIGGYLLYLEDTELDLFRDELTFTVITDTVSKFSQLGSSWTDQAVMPVALAGSAACRLGLSSDIYVFGGNGADGPPVLVALKFTGSWSSVTPSGSKLVQHSATPGSMDVSESNATAAYVTGGYYDNDAARKYESWLSDSWTSMNSLGVGRLNHTSATLL